MQEKKQLRQQIITQRQELDGALKQQYDTKICSLLEQKIAKHNCKVVHTFLPMSDEINLYPLLQRLVQKNIQLICPKTLKKRKLEHLKLQSLDALEEGLFGTRHPTGNQVWTDSIDLIIVPGLAFDKDLNRLGYGAGYYDNFLKDYPSALKVAVAYPFQILASIPTEPHDFRVDEVLCPSF